MTAPVWNTPAGSIGIFQTSIVFQFSASAVAPATTLTYTLLSGTLPPGVTLNSNGLLLGNEPTVSIVTTYPFAIRVTDNLGNIQDRTFTITIAAAPSPAFTTPAGQILTTLDSLWVEYPILYSNPVSSNPVTIGLIQGNLPPGLEINEYGIIRGYPNPPVTYINFETVVTYATVTSSINNSITVVSTSGFVVGRQITFTGTSFGNIIPGQTYYVASIINNTQFTISTSQYGPIVSLTNDSGFLTTVLPNSVAGEPTITTYSFSLELQSPLGNDLQSYFITVINQNTPTGQGGPGLPPHTRVPTILNTRPESYDITNNPEIYAYYILPENSNGNTYPTNVPANIGSILSGELFQFEILGYDFDGDSLKYNYIGLPLGLIGDPYTGWISGTPVVSPNTINTFTFDVQVQKANFPTVQSTFFTFSFVIANDINGTITWLSPSVLGTLSNGTPCTFSVFAECDIPLQYEIISGSLPPNLNLLSNGEIVGNVAWQPQDELTPVDTTLTYNFTVKAYSPNYPLIQSTQNFSMSVYQEFDNPCDTLYITAAPPLEQRLILEGLLQNPTLIPPSFIYRPDDPNFGVATDVTYVHAYGIDASDFDQYVAAVTQNHYWRNLTLGQINTAVAKDSNGNVIYEVVYSNVIDNLVNPQGISIPESIEWPRPIPLFLGPWYTSVTDIYTSYIYPDSNGNPTYYTSLDPGHAQELYPNSLIDMRERVGQVLGQTYSSSLLPAWMTSQQSNGGTLGFVPAWVICYTLPGTTTLNGQTVSYAEYIQYQIQNNWLNYNVNGNPQPYVLNQINFEIDRFSVNKSMTYDYNNTLTPPAWTDLPSGTPVPNPLDSKDFYVLFPRKTILPNTYP